MLALKHFFTFLPPERLEALAYRYDVEAWAMLNGRVVRQSVVENVENHAVAEEATGIYSAKRANLFNL